MFRRTYTMKERGYTINENFRGSRDTKRENCDRNPGTERFMSLPRVCVIYTVIAKLQNLSRIATHICVL